MKRILPLLAFFLGSVSIASYAEERVTLEPCSADVLETQIENNEVIFTLQSTCNSPAARMVVYGTIESPLGTKIKHAQKPCEDTDRCILKLRVPYRRDATYRVVNTTSSTAMPSGLISTSMIWPGN